MLAATIVVGLSMSGCVSTMQRPVAPKVQTPIYAIKYSPNSMNMPMGTTTLDESSLAIRQSGAGDGAGVMVATVGFGVIGVLAAQAIMQSQTKESITYVDRLKNVNMPQYAFHAMDTLAKEKKLIPLLKPVNHIVEGERYEVRPFLYFEADEKHQHELLVILRVAQLDRSNKEKWLGQYIKHIHVADIKSLSDETYLHTTIGSAVQESVDIFNQDMKGLLKKDEKKKVTIKVKDSIMFEEGIFAGWILPSSDQQRTLYQGVMDPSAIQGGIHILETSRVEEIKPCN